ncbi:unnamed protein product [Prorocentrum cordatum]|uniref:Uncharacterized protein n=1 Tax=Prorocentrum cordatum TaxID=2364126 RepID=A0ABN9UJS2_9DINO|nr:unnamed protein product [Polarella glacialis]
MRPTGRWRIERAITMRKKKGQSRGREEGVRQGDEDRAKGRHGGPQAAGGSCTEATRTRTPRQASSLSTTISVSRGRRTSCSPAGAAQAGSLSTQAPSGTEICSSTASARSSSTRACRRE